MYSILWQIQRTLRSAFIIGLFFKLLISVVVSFPSFFNSFIYAPVGHCHIIGCSCWPLGKLLPGATAGSKHWTTIRFCAEFFALGSSWHITSLAIFLNAWLGESQITIKYMSLSVYFIIVLTVKLQSYMIDFNCVWRVM